MSEQKKEKPKHLGRGLASLLNPIITADNAIKGPIPIMSFESKFPPNKELRESLGEIQVDLISTNPYQPRLSWNQEELAGLAESVRVNGVIQPIIVRQKGAGYQLIAGERRFRAAQLAGLRAIPAVVRQATDEQMLELALVENIHRADLNPIERAKAYQNYMNTFSLTQEEVSKNLGENRSVVANFLRLLDLPEEIKQMLIDGQLTMGHARAILSLPTDELRRKLANRAMAGRLSVREVERIVRRYMDSTKQTKTVLRSKSNHIIDLENKLASRLGTKVNIETKKNGQRGKIVIEFYSLDEFDRIAEKIGLSTSEDMQ